MCPPPAADVKRSRKVTSVPTVKETNIIRRHNRNSLCVWVFPSEDGGGWLVPLPNGNGWLHGDLAAALANAEWLSENFGGLPIQMPRSAAA